MFQNGVKFVNPPFLGRFYTILKPRNRGDISWQCVKVYIFSREDFLKLTFITTDISSFQVQVLMKSW